MRLRLSALFPLLIGSMTLLLFLAWLALDYHSDREELQRETAERLRFEVSELRSALEQEFMAGESGDLRLHLARWGTRPEVSRLLVVDPEGKVLHSLYRPDLGLPALQVDPRFDRARADEAGWLRRVTLVEDASGTRLQVYAPLVLGSGDSLRPDRIGVLYLDWNNEPALGEMRDRIAGMALGVGTGLFLIALLAVGIWNRLVTRRLLRLNAAALRLADGDLSVRTGLAPGDELGTLGRVFDLAADSLAAQQAELQALNRRFRLLSAANRVLVRAQTPEAVADGVGRLLVEEAGCEAAGLLLDEGGCGAQACLCVWQSREGIGFKRQPLDQVPAVARSLAEAARDSGERQRWMPEVAGEPGYEALPLTAGGHCHGVLLVKAPDLAEGADAALLGELAEDIAFALKALAQDRQIQSSEARLRSLVQQAPHGVLIADVQGHIEEVNPALCRMFGREAAELVGRPVVELLPAEVMYPVADDAGGVREFTGQRADGSAFPFTRVLDRVEVGTGSRLVLFIEDISERRAAEARIRALALTDGLTGLANRHVLLEEAERVLAQARRSGARCGLLFIDLDGFKDVNDSLGHEQGDRLLQEIARRLRGELFDSDLIARLGGDEFAVLLPQLPQDRDDAASRISVVCRKLIAAIEAPVDLGGYRCHLSASIGVAVSPDDGVSPAELLQNADTAMYRVKAEGKGNFRFFEKFMNLEVLERLAIESRLRDALATDAFSLHFQPIMDARTGRPWAVEALLRWAPPGQEPVSPARFIPVAEQTGLIVPIGDWVLRTACERISALQQEGLWRLLDHVSVNVSPLQFESEGFVERLIGIVEAAGVRPEWLKLEVTEGLFLRGAQRTLAQMQRLREAGFRLSVDDFGTGYSSLAYLKQLPIDELKIDRSFVRDIGVDRNDAAIVETIVAMARHLSLSVVAEGVEEAVQERFLTELGTDYLQGYRYSRPMPGDALSAWLRRNAAPRVVGGAAPLTGVAHPRGDGVDGT